MLFLRRVDCGSRIPKEAADYFLYIHGPGGTSVLHLPQLWHHEADICGLRCDHRTYILVSAYQGSAVSGDSNEQGRLFGILEGGRGVVSATAVFVLLGLFNSLGGGKFGLSWVIRSYALLAIIVGIALWFLIKDKKEDVVSGTSLVQQIKSVLLMPKMWMICLIIFTAYSIYAILSFLPPYMVSVYGMSKNFSVQIGGIRYIIQFAGESQAVSWLTRLVPG